MKPRLEDKNSHTNGGDGDGDGDDKGYSKIIISIVILNRHCNKLHIIIINNIYKLYES